MIALEVLLNDEKITTADAEDLSVLSAIVNAGGKLGNESHGTRDETDDFDLSLWVGGLTSRADGIGDEHLNWVERRPIELGDTVVVRFIESTEADETVKSSSAGGNVNEMNEKRIFESAKEMYLKLKDKYE